MDIEEVWKAHKAATAGITDVHSVDQLKLSGQVNTLKKIKRALLTNMLWGALCIILYVLIICFFAFWQIRALFAITLIFSLWAVASALKLYLSVNDHVSGNSLLAELTRNRDALNSWMRMQNRVALCIYPFSVSAGYIWGGVMGSGRDVAFFMNKPIVWLALIVCIIVMTPLAYKLGKWLFKKSFGKIIIQLDNDIASLSADAV